VGVVAVTAVANTLRCYTSTTFIGDNIFKLAPDEATGVASRAFGTWTALSAVIRLMFALNPRNREIRQLTLFTFVLAFGYFASEVFVYKVAPLTFGTVAPLAISSITAVWMIVA
jgi:hypothetical protein